MDHLRNFLYQQIPDYDYGAIVWANELSIDSFKDAGKSEQKDKNIKQEKLEENYRFVANPNGIFNSPYYSYNLSPTTDANNDSNNVQNYISAKAPISKSGQTIEYKTLSGFYGFVINKKGFPNNLPSVVNNALFDDFQAANPDGNLTLDDSSNSNNKVEAYGRLYGTTIINADQDVDTMIKEVESARTFRAFNAIAERIAT